MGKSIIDPNTERCFLCQRVRPLEAHHIFHGTARRRLADEDGMIVHICRECHQKVHEAPDGELDRLLKIFGEEMWLMHYEKTSDDFIKRYGKNYLADRDDREEANDEGRRPDTDGT